MPHENDEVLVGALLLSGTAVRVVAVVVSYPHDGAGVREYE